MDRRSCNAPAAPWVALWAACCLVAQALASGLALGGCVSPDLAPTSTLHSQDLAEEPPHGPGKHEHRDTPDCCFLACHFLGGKIAPSPAPVALAAPGPAIAAPPAPTPDLRSGFGGEHSPQNPRAPPQLA